MSTRAKLPVFEVVEEAFKFAWRKLPALVILMLSAGLLIIAPFVALMFWAGASLFGDMVTSGALEQTADPDIDAGSFAIFMLAYFLLLFGVLLFYATIATQFIRNIMNGERLWLIRINRNTFLYILAQIVIGLLFIPVYFLTAAPIIGGVVLMEAGELANGWILAPAILLALMILVYFAVRLSLIPIDVVAQGRFAVGAGFKAGRGNTLRLFGVYLVLIVMILVVELIALVVLLPLMMLAPVSMPPEVITAMETDPTVLLDFITPILNAPFMLAFSAFLVLLWTFLIGVMYSAPVFAYRHLMEANSEDSSEA